MSAAAQEADTGTEFIIEAGTFGTFLDAVSAFVDECKLRFTDQGLAVTAVDPANVAMVDTTVSAESMESYEFRAGVIGINLERLQDIVGLGNKGDLLQVRFDRERRKLIISGDGFEYDYATIDPEAVRQEPDIPDLDLDSTIVIDADDVDRVCSGSEMVSDHVTLTTDPADGFLTEAEGDTDDLRFEFDEDDLEKVEEVGDVASMLSLDYLDEITGPLVGPVEVQIGDEFPVFFEYEAPHGPVSYMIAPRIQAE